MNADLESMWPNKFEMDVCVSVPTQALQRFQPTHSAQPDPAFHTARRLCFRKSESTNAVDELTNDTPTSPFGQSPFQTPATREEEEPKKLTMAPPQTVNIRVHNRFVHCTSDPPNVIDVRQGAREDLE